MIERHTGRGLNYACDCEFCVAKKAATATIGSAHYLMRTSRYGPASLHAYKLDPDAIGNWIWCLRREARRQVRETLKQLKDK